MKLPSLRSGAGALMVVLWGALTLWSGQLQASKSDSGVPPQAASPQDPDLITGKSCRGFPSASTLKERLPAQRKELVVMWPRVGRDRSTKGCVVVARLTAVDHQGLVLTVSARLGKEPVEAEELDYKVLSKAKPAHARFWVAPRPNAPHLIVEARAAPSTSREALEAALDFVRPEDFLQLILPQEK